jgi:hypothetical protein
LSIVAWPLEDGEPKRAIAVHALQNLATSDTGISMPRRKLREQIERVRDGLDPMNVIRDEQLADSSPPERASELMPS